ncbi:type 2 lanthipeptide synthetase LanM [Streptomyces mirabilis]|uniref:type 2 lanthipeptide synthetase LanM n=1 Tax=Streptomyces mirabilis TaxID=68239 RepID=UPI0038191DDA
MGPLVVQAAEELREQLAGLIPKSLSPALFLPDTALLLAMIRPVLLAELAAARTEGRLVGSTPKERFDRFTAKLREPDTALAILHAHPVLADSLAEHFRTWVRTRAEFMARLSADLDELIERFGLDARSPQDVVRAEFGAGDPHRGGRTVAIVTFRDGRRLVYKPRSLSIETHFDSLLKWVNAREPRHPLRQPDNLDRATHGWCAFIEPEPCRDPQELARFFWRQGAFLALFYVLRTYDLHFENVIAAGEHPAFIDLEAMFHTEPLTSGPEAEEDEVARSLRESVLAVGLLPHWLVEIDESGVRAQDQSGLTGGSGADGLELHPTLGYTDPGTDMMRLVWRRRPARRTYNAAMPPGHRILPLSLQDQLITGFQEMYWLLLSGRVELMAPGGPLERFEHDEARVVLRDTHRYKEVLQQTWLPGAPAAQLEREPVLSMLAEDVKHLVGHAEIVASERRQLERGDIPMFHAIVSGTSLVDDSGTVVPQFAASSGMELVRARLRDLSVRDLQQQLWYIRAALASLETGAHHQRPTRRATAGPVPEITEELAATAARRLGDELLDTVVRDGRTGVVEWRSLELVGGTYWRVGPSGLGLYAGVSGIALFLAELGSFCDDSRYRGAAEEVLDALVDPDDMPGADDLEGLSVGGYEELGGLVYVLTRLGVLWETRPLLDVAEHLVPAIRRNVNDAGQLHVVGGSAGAVLALAHLYRASPRDETQEALKEAAQVLLAGAPSRLGAGFGHGAAGVAYALDTAAALTGDDRYRAGAALAWKAEKTLSAGELEGGSVAGPVAWCRGSAGTALAAAAAGRHMPSAVAATRAALIRGVDNDSLCHGQLGIAESLLSCGRRSGDAELVAQARRAAGRVAVAVLAARERTGIPGGVRSPGLMAGTSGIGYGLLRLAAPDRVPNLLLLGDAGGGLE